MGQMFYSLSIAMGILITFGSYMKKETSIEGLSLKVKRGETIGIIGGTGSGKSTLVNLIPRFYDCTQGSIKIDGVM